MGNFPESCLREPTQLRRLPFASSLVLSGLQTFHVMAGASVSILDYVVIFRMKHALGNGVER